MKRVALQPAYVLHRRAYRETSFIVELFTLEYGVLSVIAKGARRPRYATQGLLQPFIPLLVSFAGKGELMTLSQIEADGASLHLEGNALYAGFYLNELLITLLQKWDAHTGLYHAYQRTLSALEKYCLNQAILRSFEKKLLEELGYGLLPQSEMNLFKVDSYYQFTAEQGWTPCDIDPSKLVMSANVFCGKSLLAFAKEEWLDEESLHDARRLMRLVLTPLLGARPIYSRRLFKPLAEKKI